MVQFTPAQLDDAARVLLLRCVQLGPDYATKLQIMRDDRGWEPWQIIGACVAYVLEHDLQTEIPNHPDFEPGTARGPAATLCERCGGPLTPKYRDQKFHVDPGCPIPVPTGEDDDGVDRNSPATGAGGIGDGVAGSVR
ncbi:hypothetical protein EPO05_06080 [Patescibacteria group bacterium]|nr:MAG: hypothetical protein EPO05_06080 [Patescibacteria group bacterium]